MNMAEWVENYIHAPIKKPIPILSFPGTQIIGHTVDELVRDGHLQARCMEAIAKRYDTGAAVSLMDLSVEAEAFGAEVHYNQNEVPTIHSALITDEETADALIIPEIGAGRTGEYIKAIKEAAELITDRPIFAGIIGPYSLAGRLLDMTEIMILCYEEPEMVETVLKKAAAFLIKYAKAFKDAGADGIILAEPAAGLLSPALIADFSNPYIKQIREAVEDDSFLVLYHNCGNITPLMEQICDLDMRAYSVGNAIDIEDALKALPNDCIVIGNLDPAGIIKNASPDIIKKETIALMQRCCQYKNFIIASGCDIPPCTPLENIDAFFEGVQEYYKTHI